MTTLAEGLYRDAQIGATVTLPKAGTPIENNFVYDSSAREIMALADRGLVQIVFAQERGQGTDALISELVFRKLS